MRRFAFIAPLAAVMAMAASAHGETHIQAQPSIIVTLGPKVQAKAEELGEREVARQADRLAEVVRRALARTDTPRYSEVWLTLMELKPNRPTFHQVSTTPGLSAIDSLSIGGAVIDVEVVGLNGERTGVSIEYFSHNLADVRGATTWQDADRAYARVAARLESGRI